MTDHNHLTRDLKAAGECPRCDELRKTHEPGADNHAAESCNHLATYFSRERCPAPCGVSHTLCAQCGAYLERCAHEESA